MQGKKCKKFNYFQNQNDTCALFVYVGDAILWSAIIGTCIRKLISRHCLDKTPTRWNDYLFLITDDRDFCPQTCTNGLVFRECKHIKYFWRCLFHQKLASYYPNTNIIFSKKFRICSDIKNSMSPCLFLGNNNLKICETFCICYCEVRITVNLLYN